MGEMLTIKEIEARYAPEWVLIAEPEIDEEQTLLGGVAVHASRDHDDIYRRATGLDLDRIAVRHLGPWPKDTAFVP